MPRKTRCVKFNTEFVIEFDNREPFDSVGSVMGPPDINAFIAAGMKALGVENGNILGGAKFGMNLHFPRPTGPGVATAKPRRRKV